MLADRLVTPADFSDRLPDVPAPVAEPSQKRSNSTVSLNGSVSRLRLQGAAEGAGPLSGRATTMIDTSQLATQKPHMSSVPPEVFKGWLDKTHPQFALNVANMASQSVVVVKGRFDDSAKTLQKLQIPHERIGAGDLKSYPLDNTKVLIVDCPGELSREACQRVRDFVARGGYLLSTDWALNNFLSNTFNQYVIWNSGTNHGTMYDATVRDADAALFNGTVSNAYWKMDPECHLIHVVNRDAVRVLVTSQKLQGDDPDRQGILAVEFPFGRGFVLHIAGHFDNNSTIPFSNFLPDPAPNIGISLRQALSANFVVAGLSGVRIANNHQR